MDYIMEEIWKDIPNYNGLYKASNLGRIKNKKNIILKNYLNKRTGYIYTHISVNGKPKNIRTHRLVAQAFIPNPENKPYVNHKDGNKQNNTISNLEWCTPKENSKHAKDVLHIDFSKRWKVSIIKRQKKVMRSDGKIYNSIKEAKENINNKHAHIVEVCEGKLKTACGYGWKYYKGDD